jgi:hypothetical protein
MSEAPVTGGCVCGAVQFEIRPPYLAMQYCFCSRCRKQSGTAHNANLFVPADQLVFTAGQEHVRRFELATAKYWCNAFCEICGSRLPWLSKTGKAWLVGSGALDGDPGIRPQRDIWWASRAPWYVPPSELPCFDEGPPR